MSVDVNQLRLEVARGQLPTRYPRGRGASIACLLHRDRFMLGFGTQVIASTDLTHFHRRASPGRLFAAVEFEGTIYAAGANSTFAATSDRGESWQTLASPKDPYLMAVHRTARGEWFLGGMNGVWHANRPQGPWETLSEPATVRWPRKGKTLGFFELPTGLLVIGADTRLLTPQRTLASVPGLPSSAVITAVTRSPAGTLIAIGDNGVVFRSTNEGASFSPVSSGVGEALEDCDWVAGALLIVGAHGLVLCSTDDGLTFSRVPLETSHTLWSIVSWGDGAFIGGDEDLLLTLRTPQDHAWLDAPDEAASKAAEIDPTFQPPSARPKAEREATWQRLHDAARAREAQLRAGRPQPIAQNPELAQAIDSADDPTTALQVYADWLLSIGDARGQLASLQTRLDGLTAPSLAQEAEALAHTFLPVELAGPPSDTPFWKATWKAGFLHTFRITHPAPGEPAIDVPKTIAAVLNHPSGRFLRSLTVAMAVSPEDGDSNEYGEVCLAIASVVRPSLRQLFLGDFEHEETELNWTHSGALGPLWGSLPNLERLTVRAGGMNFGDLVAPSLTHCTVITGGLSTEAASQLGRAQWPSLVELSVQVGPEGTATLDDFAPVLDGEALPRLTSLGLTNLEFMEPLVAKLATSRILPQLRSLDLQMSTLGHDGANTLLKHQAAFRHLDELNVDDNYLPPADEAALQVLAKTLRFGTQRDDGGNAADRYASALE